jgi:class 3 adenylate cyclase
MSNPLPPGDTPRADRDKTSGATGDTASLGGPGSSGVPSTVLPTIDTAEVPVSALPAGAAPPEQFGRYTLRKLLGRGGMGAVYLAHDSLLDREVALKVPHPDMAADPQILERFYREARSAARLRHPNICPVHDVGEWEGWHYLTMAYVEGRPLSARVAEFPGQPRRTAELVRTLALALDCAHAEGIVHRDLKPANIILTPEGEPVVMDFGLARQVRRGPDAQLSSSGMVLGTPAYMPPEQAMGDAAAVGPASDVYSLGVVLYELLTGRVPFAGAVTAILVRVVHDDPPLPREVRPDVDPCLEAICLRAMAKKPEQRFAGMAAFAQALTAYLADEPQAATAAAAAAPALPAPVVEEVLCQLHTWGWEQGLARLRAGPTPALTGEAAEAHRLLLAWLGGDAKCHAEAMERLRSVEPLRALAAWALLGQAFGMVRAWNVDRAEELLGQAEQFADPHDNALAGSIANLRGFLRSLQGRDSEAWPLLHQALALVGRDHFLVGHVLDTLGWVYAGRDNFLAAREFHRQALLCWQHFGNETGEGAANIKLGWIDLEWGLLDRAEERLQISLRLFQKMRDDYRTAKAYSYLGRVLLARGEREEASGKRSAARKQWARAAEWLDLALQQHQQSGRAALEVRGRIDRALVHAAEGQLAEAEEQLRRADELLGPGGSPFHRAVWQRALGRLRTAQGRHAEATAALRSAVDEFDRLWHRADAARAQLELARSLEASAAQSRLVSQAFLEAVERAEGCRRDHLVQRAEEGLKSVDEEAHWRHVSRRTRGHGVPEDTASLNTGEMEPASILFLNLRGFVPYCQGMDPEELAMTLNQMLADLGETLEQHRGLIPSYLGGGFMALFREAGHAERAVQAALDLLEKMAEFNRPRELLGLPVLPAEIGVASGPVFLGNIGSYRKLSYTAVGAAVNLASRLVRQCTEGLPCISHETFKLVQDRFEFGAGNPRTLAFPSLGEREVWDVVARKPSGGSGFRSF